MLGVVGYIVYDGFIKPASIVGRWVGSRVEFETGGPMSFMQYTLVLDDQNRAEMTLMEDSTSTGTYTLKGDRLKLTLKEKDGESTEIEYKASVGRATLDLFEPSGAKKVVQLIRSTEKPKVGGSAPLPLRPRRSPVVPVAAGPRRRSTRRPTPAWPRSSSPPRMARSSSSTPPIGKSRPAAGRTTSIRGPGSPRDRRRSRSSPTAPARSCPAPTRLSSTRKGSETAPVHTAHVLYKKTVAEEHSDYKESEPALFKGAGLGEGRLAAFSASGGGLFGGKVRGMRVTLLSRNRRVSVISECPEAEFAKLRPTFFAVSRSLSN